MHQWKLRFRQPEFSLDEDLPMQGGSPEDTFWQSERSIILQQCLNRIAPQYREALWLFYYMDLSYEQAANVMGYTMKKIDNLLSNGRNRLLFGPPMGDDIDEVEPEKETPVVKLRWSR